MQRMGGGPSKGLQWCSGVEVSAWPSSQEQPGAAARRMEIQGAALISGAVQKNDYDVISDIKPTLNVQQISALAVKQPQCTLSRSQEAALNRPVTVNAQRCKTNLVLLLKLVRAWRKCEGGGGGYSGLG